jgi:DNA-binding NtrC family response regulator
VAYQILIIDEDKLTRWFLGRMLTGFGYQVRESTSAAGGLAQAKESPPDLVLLEVRLQDRNAEAALQALRRSYPELPVVMMSADASVETVRHMRGLGASGFLWKPCAAMTLHALVAKLVKRDMSACRGVSGQKEDARPSPASSGEVPDSNPAAHSGGPGRPV